MHSSVVSHKLVSRPKVIAKASFSAAETGRSTVAEMFLASFNDLTLAPHADCSVSGRLNFFENKLLPLQLAEKEDRVVITSGAPYQKLKRYLAPGRCFNMDTSLPAREQLKKVLQFYNVVVNEENLLTRCLVCNTSHYALVAHADMRQLCEFQATTDRHMLESTTMETLTRSYGADCLLDLHSGYFSNGTRVQCGSLFFEHLAHVETFCVCTSCGKVYWEGSHHRRLKQQMRLANLLSCDAPLVDVPGCSTD